MQCSRPGAVTEEDLIAYADGEAPAAVEAHLRECAHCAARARGYAQTQAWLRRALGLVNCPTPQMLADYECGLLAATERTALARHIIACPRCTAELATLRAFLGAPEPSAAGLGPLAGLRRLVAVLERAPLPATSSALRGSAESTVLVFRAGEVTVTVEVRRAGHRPRFAIVGLVLREGAGPQVAGGSTVSLSGAGGFAHATKLDELGNFEFTEVPPDVYRLEVGLDDAVVVVEDLRVGD